MVRHIRPRDLATILKLLKFLRMPRFLYGSRSIYEVIFQRFEMTEELEARIESYYDGENLSAPLRFMVTVAKMYVRMIPKSTPEMFAEAATHQPEYTRENVTGTIVGFDTWNFPWRECAGHHLPHLRWPHLCGMSWILSQKGLLRWGPSISWINVSSSHRQYLLPNSMLMRSKEDINSRIKVLSVAQPFIFDISPLISWLCFSREWPAESSGSCRWQSRAFHQLVIEFLSFDHIYLDQASRDVNWNSRPPTLQLLIHFIRWIEISCNDDVLPDIFAWNQSSSFMILKVVLLFCRLLWI